MRSEDSIELSTINCATSSSVESYSILPEADSHFLAVPGYDAARVESDDGLLESHNVVHQRNRTKQKMQQLLPSFARLIHLAGLNAWFGEGDGPRKHRGWRKAVIAAAVLAGVVLLANLTLAIVAAVKYKTHAGVGVLYQGDCTLIERWNTALHLLINVLGTCLLSASSFTMQCLSSPTRSETDRAHSKRKSLEIGVPSVRNLSYMHWWKGCLWWALCLSTLPLHLFWNSTVFSTLGAHSSNYLVIDESFLSGADYLTPATLNETSGLYSDHDVSDPAVYLEGYRAGNYTTVDVSECLNIYLALFVTSHRKLMAVTRPQEGMRMSPGERFPTLYTNLSMWYGNAWSSASPERFVMGYIQPLWNGSSVLAYQGSLHGTASTRTSTDVWQCIGWPISEDRYGNTICDADFAKKQLQENGTWWLRPVDSQSLGNQNYEAGQAYPIDYCLVESKDIETCQLQYASYILTLVVCCNFVKLLCMIATARYLWSRNEPIFATIGDAVSSYMDKPDQTTAGWCLMDFSTCAQWKERGASITRDQNNPRERSQKYHRKPVVRLLRATSLTRWGLVMVPCLIYWIMGIWFLSQAVSATLLEIKSGSTIWSEYSLGKVTNDNLMHLNDAEATANSRSLLSSILAANSFQVALSITYFLFNSLWTAQCSAIEWVSYYTKRKPLRVTWPRGQQRSTYYLNLPYRYGIPLTVMLAVLHFLISQSVFLARVQYYYADGTLWSGNFISDAAFSPLGILVTLCISFALLLMLIVHSFRKIDNRMPHHGNSSAVISAMCHTNVDHPEVGHGVAVEHPAQDMAERPVMWGAVKSSRDTITFKNDISVNTGEEQTYGHCAFSAEDVGLPEFGKWYR